MRPYSPTISFGHSLSERNLAAHNHTEMAGAAIDLDVWEHNLGAQRFYKRLGFEVVGTRVFEVESAGETSLDLVMVRRMVIWQVAKLIVAPFGKALSEFEQSWITWTLLPVQICARNTIAAIVHNIFSVIELEE